MGFILFIVLFIVLILLKRISGYKLLHYVNMFYSTFINDREFYKTDYDWCKNLRNNYKKITREYINYIKNHGKLLRFKDIDRVQTDYDISDIPWDVLFLRVYNKDTSKIKYFPETYNLISKIPGCSLAMFSVLHPGKIIPPHTGPFKGVLRYHLALITPKKSNKCKITVNKIEYHWQTGKDVIFDDTFIHNVENNTDESRVVLFLDIQRDFENIFLNIINNVVLYFSKFNDSVNNIVVNTNNS
jgi:beta-hydroxylase